MFDMKRSLILLAMLGLLLTGCATQPQNNASTSSLAPSSTPEPEPKPIPKTLKILTIGNSFSLNATRYLAPILNDYGVENATVGVLYRGSSSLQEHYFYAQNRAVGYHYYQADNAVGFVETQNVNFYYALEQQDWDIIIMQHGAGKQGVAAPYDEQAWTYVYNRAKELCPNGTFHWHMDRPYVDG